MSNTIAKILAMVFVFVLAQMKSLEN